MRLCAAGGPHTWQQCIHWSTLIGHIGHAHLLVALHQAMFQSVHAHIIRLSLAQRPRQVFILDMSDMR